MSRIFLKLIEKHPDSIIISILSLFLEMQEKKKSTKDFHNLEEEQTRGGETRRS